VSADPFAPEAIAAAYNTVAEDYVTAFGNDLVSLPVDRRILDAAARRMGEGVAVDVGSGPGQVSRYLAERGHAMIALDLAPRMLTVEREDGRVGGVCADMRRIPLRSESCAGAFVFYSLQHLPRLELPVALGELRRVLRPGGVLVIATHLGVGEVCLTEFLGHRVSPFAGTLHDESDLDQDLHRHSFTVVERRRRGPLAHEYPSQRLYILAERRGTVGDLKGVIA
jgi:ubiquinone/menaquinone biosynthesis C-methylase UbiE